MIKLGLFMIVKNESKIIKRCLESIREYIDFIVISDTGSTDKTVEYINDFLTLNKIPGKVYIDEWKNFGHNRTKSFINTQEWLKENNYNLQNTYLLTIDADMIIKVNPFEKDILKEKTSWNIRQINPIMTYYNKRIFCSNMKFKCIGVTHEYWGCDEKDTDDKMDDIYIQDIGDGGSKSDKFDRDIRLLTQGLIDEPENERYFFYLAQSYSDLGNKEEAINYYKKRINKGGWVEEVFISHLRLGDIYMDLKNYEKALFWWGLAYDYLPSRSETLFRIINYNRLKGKNNLALLYLNTALKIDYPKDQVLFIEHPVYEYKLIEELSISGFYTKYKLIGFIACDYLIMKRNIPEIVKKQCYNNLFFYIPKLTLNKIIDFDFKVDDPYISSSQSLYKTKLGFSGVIRTVNYSINNNFNYIIRDEYNNVKTKNYWIDIDKKGKVFKNYEIINLFDKKKRNSNIQGLEDIRLCKIGTEYNYKLIGLATSFEYGYNNHPSVCICSFEKDDLDKYIINKVVPTNYKNNEIQKNWAPFYENNKLYAIYSHEPLTIIEINIDNGNCSIVVEKKNNLYDLSNIRGSSSPIKLPNDHWLIIVHDLIFKDKRIYFHRFILYDKNWELKKISLPFYFEELFIEFCLSMSFDIKTEEITIFFSKLDNFSKMVNIKINDISWIPDNFNIWIKDILK